jgi:hypothetical protein
MSEPQMLPPLYALFDDLSIGFVICFIAWLIYRYHVRKLENKK